MPPSQLIILLVAMHRPCTHNVMFACIYIYMHILDLSQAFNIILTYKKKITQHRVACLYPKFAAA